MVGRFHCAVGHSLSFVVFQYDSGRESPRGASPELLPLRRSSRVPSLSFLAEHRSARLLSWTSCSLRHESGSRVHLTDGFPRPPSFRLQGLATLLTAYSPRTLVSFVSCSQHPWDLPLRSLTCLQAVAVSPLHATRLPFLLRLMLSPKTKSTATQAATPGSYTCRRHWRQPADSRGVLLSRVLPIAELDPLLRGSPLLCFARATTHATL